MYDDGYQLRGKCNDLQQCLHQHYFHIMTTPRGIANNNPGNIRWGDDWQGLVPVGERTDQDFCQFTGPAWGIRAIFKILASYKDEGIMTIADAIARWAPPSENNTAAYASDVATRAGIDASSCIDLTDQATASSIVKAIIFHENGSQPYPEYIISQAYSLAGVSA
jgi:hypothetical protein